MNSGLLYELAVEVSDGGGVVVELFDLVIFRELHCYFDGVLLVDAVDRHAPLLIGWNGNGEGEDADHW